jgi:hypothetical protein
VCLFSYENGPFGRTKCDEEIYRTRKRSEIMFGRRKGIATLPLGGRIIRRLHIGRSLRRIEYWLGRCASSSRRAASGRLLNSIFRVFFNDVSLYGLRAFDIGVAANSVAHSRFGHTAAIEPIGMVGVFRQLQCCVVIGKRLVELPELQMDQPAIGKDLGDLWAQIAGLVAVIKRLLQFFAENSTRPAALTPQA